MKTADGIEAMPAISVVVPVLDEAESLPKLLEQLESTFGGFDGGWETIAVDDGSGDNTWAGLVDAAKERPWLRGVRLARRFGQHPATFAGLAEARGSIIAVIDADLQVGVQDVLELVEKVRDGADVAFAARDHSLSLIHISEPTRPY